MSFHFGSALSTFPSNTTSVLRVASHKSRPCGASGGGATHLQAKIGVGASVSAVSARTVCPIKESRMLYLRTSQVYWLCFSERWFLVSGNVDKVIRATQSEGRDPLVLLRRRQIRRRKIRVILQILLPGLVAKHHPESPPRIHIDGFLQIQFVEWDHVLGGLCWIILGQAAMNLPIHHPVVGHAVPRAVLLIQPNEIVSLPVINVLRTLVSWQRDIIFKTTPGKGQRIAIESPAPAQIRTAGRPPKR